MIPRYGSPPRRDKSYTHRPGGYVILPLGDKILLTHQAEPTPEFQLPGGGIDPGEHTLPAIRREVMEETGWCIGRLVRFGTYRRFAYMPEYDKWAEKLCHVFLARPVREIGPPTEAGHSAHLIGLEAALECLGSPGDTAMLHHAIQSGATDYIQRRR